MQSLSEILKAVRKILDITQDDLAHKLGIHEKTYGADERGARPDKIHGNHEFYKNYKDLLGIDLYTSVNDKRIVITDRTKLSWDKIEQLKEIGAYISRIPVFNLSATAGIIPLYQDERNVQPSFFLPEEMHPGGEFGIQASGNSMEPEIHDGDYIICGPRLTSNNIISGHIYLVGTSDEENTIKTLHVDKRQNKLLLMSSNPSWAPKLIPMDKIRYVHKVIGHHRKEDGINQYAITIY
jgi:phage repressor protein C with HTH and peptisase S24 domain